ncbi:MAG: hypothetical protein ACOYLO_08145 [Ferruginibacter sp.]
MKKIIAALCLLVPFAGMAHPGHGEIGGYTITHYFLEPMHAIITIGIVVALVVYVRHLNKSRQTK